MSFLNEASNVVEYVLDKEEESLSNLEEYFEGSRMCEKKIDAIDKMNEVVEVIDSAKDLINDVIRL